MSISPNQFYIETFDNHDGSYLIKYRVTLAGDFVLRVQTNLDAINVQTSTITVVPNLAYASTSTLVFVTPVTLDI